MSRHARVLRFVLVALGLSLAAGFAWGCLDPEQTYPLVPPVDDEPDCTDASPDDEACAPSDDEGDAGPSEGEGDESDAGGDT